MYGYKKKRMNISNKIYSVACKKYINFINPKISCIFYNEVVRSIICGKYRRIFKEIKRTEILKTLS